jgi:UDP-N-acetylmuramoyl-tripeptide--D-alanyl-D-alanine ligase
MTPPSRARRLRAVDMKLLLDDAVRATGARVLDASQAPRELVISTDTRSLQSGEAFLALRGENFDGHAFTASAVEAGANALIVDREEAGAPGVATLVVTDTKRAYMKLAGAVRAQFEGEVIGITGSVGKTTTKALLAQLLAAAGRRVVATPENENNEIGVSKLMLSAPNDADVMVVEMGARRCGDIAELVEIARPDIGVLTNIGEAHLEIMGSRERLEETKWGLFSGGARAVLNALDEASRRRGCTLASTPRWFAASAESLDDEPLPSCNLAGRSRFIVAEQRAVREYSIDVLLPGAYNCENLAAALTAVIELGLFESDEDREAVLNAIPGLTLPHGRFERIALRGFQLIYDAYNANLSGMSAALGAFAEEMAARRIAVLASMAELGSESDAMHERVGEIAASTVDWLLVGGEFANSLARGAQRGGLPAQRIVFFESNTEAARWLQEHAKRDDLVLLKGSRKYRLEEILNQLRSAAT